MSVTNFPVSFSESGYTPYQFNPRKYCLHLTNWAGPDRSSKGCKDANSFFKGCFHYCRRHCCFSSLLTHLVCKHLFPCYLFYLDPCCSVNSCVCCYIYVLDRVSVWSCLPISNVILCSWSLLQSTIIIMYDFILLLFSYYSLGLDKMKEMILHSVQLVSIIIVLLFI